MYKNKYHFTYQTKNLINGKTYVGVHSTNKIDDGYIGCGINSIKSAKRKKLRAGGFPEAVRKYGYNNFKREILAFFDTAEDAYEEEKFIVDENWVKSTNNYNIALGGVCGNIKSGKDHSDYISDIYQININTGEVVNVTHTAGEMSKKTGLYQSRISEILKGRKSRYKQFFFTRNPVKWREEREEICSNIFKERVRLSTIRKGSGAANKIAAFDLDGNVFKEFNSQQEALRYFNKSKLAGKTISDSILYTQNNPDKPRVTYGYIWRKI